MSDLRPDPLSPELKALLEAAKGVPKVPSAVKARVFERAMATLAMPAVGLSIPSDAAANAASSNSVASAAAATGSAWKAAAVVKLAVAVGASSFAAGGAAGVAWHSSVATAPAPMAVVAQPSTPAPETLVPTEPPPPLPPLVVAEVPVVARPAVRALPKPQRDQALAEERSLVEQARAALARGNATAALETLALHHKRFARGQLQEEASALEVLALASAGKTDQAKDKAAKFKAKYPASMLRPAVESAAPQ